MSDKGILSRVASYFSTREGGQSDFDTVSANKAYDTDNRIIKQDVDRRVETASAVLNAAQRNGAKMWEIDPATLNDYATNPVVAAYEDTIAKDVGSLDWEVRPKRGEDVSDERIRKSEQRLDELPRRGWSMNDLIEATTRTMVRTGNGAWGFHFSPGNPTTLEEIVAPPMASMYKVIGEDGQTDGYVQVTKSNRNATKLSEDEVAWFEWASDPDRTYGVGPVEMCRESIIILDEIGSKEEKDLKQGAPSGFFRVGTDVTDKDFEAFKKSYKMDEGERHRSGPIRADDAEFIPIDPGYEDLKLLERWKRSVVEVGAAMKVNPSYVGLNFDEGNRAKDEQQTANYEKRGLQVIIDQIESGINNQLIAPHFGDDLEFHLIEERDNEEHADYLLKAGQAMNELQDAGLDVEWEDGRPVVIGTRDGFDAGADDGDTDAGEDVVEMSKNIGDANPTNLTPKQQEVEAAYNESFDQVLRDLEMRHDTRRGAIDELKERLDGSLSPNTYYKWIRDFDIMEATDDEDDEE